MGPCCRGTLWEDFLPRSLFFSLAGLDWKDPRTRSHPKIHSLSHSLGRISGALSPSCVVLHTRDTAGTGGHISSWGLLMGESAIQKKKEPV